MSDLLTYIKERNAETQAWMDEDKENRFAFFLVDDLEFWAERGITTVEQFVRDQLVGSYSDAHKELYGIRPRGADLSAMSNEDLEQEIDHMYQLAAEDAAEQKELEEYHAELEKEALRIAAMLNSEPLKYEEYDIF